MRSRAFSTSQTRWALRYPLSSPIEQEQVLLSAATSQSCHSSSCSLVLGKQTALRSQMALCRSVMRTTALELYQCQWCYIQMPLLALLRPEGKIAASAFVGAWKSIPDTSEVQKQLSVNISNADVAKGKLEAANIFVMAHKQVAVQRWHHHAPLLAITIADAAVFLKHLMHC